MGLATIYHGFTIPVFSRPLSLAIPLWDGTMSTSDDFGPCWGRNSEFYTAVGPVNKTAGILAYFTLA